MKNIEKYRNVVLESLNNCHLEKSLRELYGETVVCCPHTNCDECKKRLREWLLEEAKEPILDDAEKDYLSTVIKPFRDKVTSIAKKHSSVSDYEHLCVIIYPHEVMFFPQFKSGKMYKNMRPNTYYSLKELGL